MILAGLTAGIIKSTIGVVIGSVERAWVAYQNKEISKEQYEAEKERALLEAQTSIFAAAQETIRASFGARSWLTRNAWAFVVLSQTLVLLWYQVGIPLYVYFMALPRTGPGSMPRTGDDLLQWAYLIVAAALGIGAWQMGREKR